MPSSTQSISSKELQIVILTGLSGAGKSTALNAYEDSGFYCIDNLPAFLLPNLLSQAQERAYPSDRIALVMDVRDRSFLDSLDSVLAEAKKQAASLKIIFFTAEEKILVRRYSQLRRPHPLAGQMPLSEGIRREKELLTELAKVADSVIDTSEMSPHDLRQSLRVQMSAASTGQMPINILSFGHKHGIPLEADLMFDVRFLPNPYYDESLRHKTGLDREVADYAMGHEDGEGFLQQLEQLLAFLAPQFERASKPYLTVAIGCTGGRHRSVAVSEALGSRLASAEIPSQIFHRDMAKK